MSIELDWDVADRITVANLKHQLACIIEREHCHEIDKVWYPEEDKEYDRKLKKAIKRVLKYFGEEE